MKTKSKKPVPYMKEKALAIFRTYKKKEWQNDVIVLFPETYFFMWGMGSRDGGDIMAYEIVGEHGEVDYNTIIAMTRPSTRAEISEMKMHYWHYYDTELVPVSGMTTKMKEKYSAINRRSRELGMGEVDTYSQGTSDYGTTRRILEDVRSISSGTMATLMRDELDPHRRSRYKFTYDDTDFIHERWIEYVFSDIRHKNKKSRNEPLWKNWMDTWVDFVKEIGIGKVVVEFDGRSVYVGYNWDKADEQYENYSKRGGVVKMFFNNFQVK